MSEHTLHDTYALRQTLHAPGPAPDRASHMRLYGQFVGSWDGTLVYEDGQGVRRETSAEVHFGWVLEGRAMQDVWIAPALCAGTAASELMHGTTLRVYDPQQDLWHITWIDPVKQVYNRMTGRKVGDDIVQEYRTEGARIQWLFTDIRADSFHWLARRSEDDGKTWTVHGEFLLRRRGTAALPEHTPVACATPEHRAFDFWVGDWRVTEPTTGAVLGENRIQRILGGVLHESWQGANGMAGQSFNAYDVQRKGWHQTWMDDTGSVLLLDGGVRDGVMDLQGQRPDGVLHRIRWTPQADGSVIQQWDASTDEGQHWETKFTGLYRRKV